MFSKALLLQVDPALLNAMALPRDLRLIAVGERDSLAAFQALLEKARFRYGEHFVLREGEEEKPFEENPFAYWFADKKKVSIKKLDWNISPRKFALSSSGAKVDIEARLKNGEKYNFYPPSLLISPPVLEWNAQTGKLSAISGAEPGRVKLTVKTPLKDFSAKITLKKQ